MFEPVASVRRRWSRLSALDASTRSPRRPRWRGQRHFPSWLSLSRSPCSPSLRRRFSELTSSCHGVSGQVTPPSTSPASLHHRRHVGCTFRASVSPHCLLRRELTSPKFHRGYRCRGQGSLVQHFFSFLFVELRLVVLMLDNIFYRSVSD